MKKNKLINSLISAAVLSMVVFACSDDDGDNTSAGFAGIASSFTEGSGDVTMVIPFVNGSVSESDIVFEGSATKDEDYEVVGVTSEGIEITFKDDADCEELETLRMLIKSSGTANKVHTVTLFETYEAFTTTELEGTYTVVTDSWEDFLPGDELTVERVDDTHIRIVEYPATSFTHAPLVVTITDLVVGTSTVASQNNGSYNASGTQTVTTTGSGIVSKCSGIDLTLNFNLPCCGAFNGNHLVLTKN